MRFFACILFLSFFGLQASAQSLADLRSAVAAGDSSAMLKLSEKFRFGSDVEASDDSAMYWANQAAENGHPEGMYLIGLQSTRRIFDAGRFKSGMQWLQKSADRGFEDARLKLMRIYSERGEGPGEPSQTARYYDLKKAFGYGLAAAEQGNTAAGMYCANAYLNGRGVAKSDSAGMAWYTWAASKKRHPKAQYLIGILWFEGAHTGHRDLFQAKYWLERCWFNKTGGLSLKTETDIALHEVDQAFKQTHNLMMQSSLLMPPGAFRYRLRE